MAFYLQVVKVIKRDQKQRDPDQVKNTASTPSFTSSDVSEAGAWCWVVS